MKRSSIAWCDFSGGNLNFVMRGSGAGECECSPGCRECYVRRLDERLHFLPDVTTYDERKVRRLCKARFPRKGVEFRRGPGSPALAFVCDTGDLFHERVADYQIIEAVDVMACRPDVDFVIVTKRAERLAYLSERYWYIAGMPRNIWLLVTCCNQEEADRNVPTLLRCKATVRGVNLEPLLGPVDLSGYCAFEAGDPRGPKSNLERLDWVIVGAESGPSRRPFEVAWAGEILRQCQAAGVPFFGKQDSGLKPGAPLLIDGHEWKEFPA